MKILLQGQLAVAAECHSLDLAVSADTTVEALIVEIAQSLPPAAQELLLNADQTVRATFFVALDGEHLRDYSTTIPTHAKEIMLLPPMAGG
jgi:molybdopterin converting factor small subunit